MGTYNRDDYREASRHARSGSWMIMKIILGFFIFFLLLGGLTMLVKPAFLYGERIITKTSFQYTEGKAQEMLTMHRDYVGLQSRIIEARNSGQSELASALETQREAIKTQMCNIASIATTKSAVPVPVRSVCSQY